jgi:RNA polymerase sigma-70 factor (ECF subfamily)
MTGLSFSPIAALRPSEPLELAVRARHGDDHAFASLVSAFQPQVYRWAVALSGDQDDADDITQEVFVRAYRKLGSFRGDGSFEGWLYRITRRVAGRTRRAVARRVETGSQDVYVTDPGSRVDRQRAIALIRTIADTLPMRQREVFVLCDLEGRTPLEAAALLKMKDVSVRASLFKARASIRRQILATHPCYREQSP